MQTVILVWFILSSTLWINLYATTPLKGENPTAFNTYPEQIHLAYGGNTNLQNLLIHFKKEFDLGLKEGDHENR